VSPLAATVLCALCAAAAVVPWWWSPRSRLAAVTASQQPPPRALDGDPVDVDVAVLLALLDAATASGAGLPRALTAVGRAVGGADGRSMERASVALVMGAGWDVAWEAAAPRLAPLVASLHATWTTGAAPGPALRAGAAQVRRDRRTAAREAAGRLGVRLVVPLGLCFLPAFILIGLVPVMVSLGSALTR
jgi:pilus assembly protein TadC